MSKGNNVKRVLKYILYLIIAFIALSILTVTVYKFVSIPVTPLMFIRSNQMMKNNQAVQIQHKWVSIDKMSPFLFQAVLAAEDDMFLEHNGFDFDAMKKAYNSNKKNTKKIKGGSTVSQQTAKNVFLWPKRSYLRKGLEAWFTILIEIIWGKERIMEEYLNVVELGNGIFGVEAASQKYFKKSASMLTKYEAASLISVLPNPNKFSVLNPSAYTVRYRTSILNRMNYIPKPNFDK